jgi:hypothetical protein
MSLSADDLLGCAQERVQQVLTAEVTLRLVDATGVPVRHSAVEVQFTNHAFKFGCDAFGLRAYEKRYAALLNYATLPFYWAMYESRPGETAADRLAGMAAWCRERGVATKGHWPAGQCCRARLCWTGMASGRSRSESRAG